MTSRAIAVLSLALPMAAAGCATLRPTPPEHDATVRLAAGLSAYDDARYADAFDDFALVARSCPGHAVGMQAIAALAALELDPRNPVGRPGVGTELLAELILDTRTPDWLRPVATTTYLLALGLGAPAARTPDATPTGPVATPAEPVDPVDPVDSGQPVDPVDPVDPAHPAEPGDPGDPDPGDPVVGTDRAAEQARAPPAAPAMETLPRLGGCGPTLPERPDVAVTLPTLPGPSLMALLAEAESEREQMEGRTAAMEAELATLRRQLAEARGELERIRRTLRP